MQKQLQFDLKPEKRKRKLPSLFDTLTAAVLAIYVSAIVILIVVDIGYIHAKDFFSLFRSEDLRFAMRLSLITATTSALLALVVGTPAGYALSRFKFRGRVIVDTLVDMPIVLPPLVVGVSLLVFFQTSLGRAIENTGLRFVYTPQGIVLAQFAVVSSYSVRTIKVAFDGVDPRLENVARTLGWSRIQSFFRVTLPMARNGILAAGVMSWSHAIGLFAPLMIFSGTTRRKTEVLATSIYLELSIGHIETALAITVLLVVFAMIGVTIVKKYVGDSGTA